MSAEVKPGYKMTEVGVIPNDWEIKRLRDISPSQAVGLVINPSSYFDEAGTVPMLVGSHISENSISWKAANKITEKSNSLIPATRLYANDLVMVRVGDPGVTAVIPPELDGCNCASMMIIRQGREFDSNWLCYVMNSDIGRNQVENVQYGTAQKQFNISDAINFVYPTPPLAEQKAISYILSEFEALIRRLDELIAKKRDIKQAAMQQLLTGQKRLPGFSGEWEVKQFGSTLKRINAKAHQIQTSAYQTTGKYPVVDQGKESVIGFSDDEDKIYRNSDEGVIVFGDHTCIVKFVDFDFLVGADGTQVIQGMKGQSTRFHAFQLQYRGIEQSGYNRHFKILKEHVFQVPPLDEQNAIAAIFSDIDAELAALEARRDKALQLKQGMMQELLTGRIRLK